MKFTRIVETDEKCKVCGRYILEENDIQKLSPFPNNVWVRSASNHLESICNTCNLWAMDRGIML